MPAPIIVAHRGASGYRPEHTLAAYELAIEMGADFIEPDLVSTKDGVLVARHENAIAIIEDGAIVEATTDVAEHPEFAHRLTTKFIDGVSLSGWFTEDFTLAELKTLRARERMPHLRSTSFDDLHEIPTLQEVIELARRGSAAAGRAVGIYPETKHPAHFRSIGLPLEEPLVAALHANGYEGPDAPAFIQSFEAASLRRLRSMTGVRLVQLLGAGGKPGGSHGHPDLLTGEGLHSIAEYARGIGPDKSLVVPRESDGRHGAPTRLIADAHAAGLIVHPWTFRSENAFLPPEYHARDASRLLNPAAFGDAEAEYRVFFALGVDGVFSDHPDAAVAARDAFSRSGKRE
jgi:glycerophosphoryl diester phosphodiesterase